VITSRGAHGGAMGPPNKDSLESMALILGGCWRW